MTAWEAAGYILGVGIGFVHQYYKVCAISLAVLGAGLLPFGSRLVVGAGHFEARLGPGFIVGGLMILTSIIIWLSATHARN